MTQIARHYSAYRGELNCFYGFRPGFTFLDLTLGDGGHTQEALEAGCKVVSTEVDPEAIERATSFVPSKFSPLVINPEEFTKEAPVDFSWIIIQTNFVKIGEIAKKLNLPKFDGIMIDLGPSQFQVLSPGRGFSFDQDEALDMRLDKNLGVTAKDLLNALNEGELASLFTELGDEPFARPIARAIVKERQTSSVSTTKQLADIVSRVKHSRGGKIHPATQVFMALRMAVNLERDVIREVLPQLPELLNKDGILGVISFHSGEDRLIKEFVKESVSANILSAINEKPITPSEEELKISPRTRSAKLRLAKKHN